MGCTFVRQKLRNSPLPLPRFMCVVIDSMHMFRCVNTHLVCLFVCLFVFIRYFLHLQFKCYPKNPLYPQTLLPNLPTPASWPWHSSILGHIIFTRPRASPPNDGHLGHPLLQMQLETLALVLSSSYCCSSYRAADPLHCINVQYFSYSFFVWGHLDCFQVLAIMKRQEINVVEWVSLCFNEVSLGYMHKNGIAGSLVISIPIFLRNSHSFHSGCTSSHSQQQ
jgi:hypothetical protein